jgi:hypothetical protein
MEHLSNQEWSKPLTSWILHGYVMDTAWQRLLFMIGANHGTLSVIFFPNAGVFLLKIAFIFLCLVLS